MKKSLSNMLCFALAVMLVLSLSACNASKKTSITEASNTQTTASQTTAPQTTEAAKPDPMGKYEAPVVITTVRQMDPNLKFAEGESADNNVWNRGFEEELGIQLKYLWTAPNQETYDQKINVAIMTNDLPDFFPLRGTEQGHMFKQLVQNNMAADITDAYNTYRSDQLHNAIGSDGGVAFSMVNDNGKMYAMPEPSSPASYMQMMWLRMDWMKKLNLSVPKTTDELINVIKEMAKSDPDGDNKANTFGVPFSKMVYQGYSANLNGFFAGYGAYVTNSIWVEKNGSLEFGAIQPEAKDALLALQDLYKEGAIDREFAAKDMTKLQEDIGSGKFGVVLGPMSASITPLSNTYKNFPGSDWKPFSIVAPAGKTVTVPVPKSLSHYYVVNKKCKNPEALVKMFNFFWDIYMGTGEEGLARYKKFFSDPEKFPGIEIFRQSPITLSDPSDIITRTDNCAAALDGKLDVSKLRPIEKSKYDSIVALNQGKATHDDWGVARVFGAEGSGTILKYYRDNGCIFFNKFYGATTPTMAERMASLMDLQLETYTKIICGADISGFDKFVAEWKKLGGDQITTEVNEWNKNK
jgi:putative aldouronate transport system substrate-binding protein